MKGTHLALAIGGATSLAAVVLILFLSSPSPESNARAIDITVSRYRFDPGSTEPINLTLGEEVVFRIRSTDVTHGFAITDYGVNVEVPAGQVVEVRLRADKPGDFVIYCTVFCGSGHPEHKGTLHVA